MRLHGSPLIRNLELKFFGWFGLIMHSKLFWIVLGLKVIASFMFGSPVLTELFIPFAEEFVARPFENTYDTFWDLGMDQSFPYPAVMLWVISLPRLMLYWVGFHDLEFNILIFVYRLPLIVADLAIFMVLCRWLKKKISLLVWLYWASPVLFFITYVHGQLDVVAMCFAFLSTYFLFSNRWLHSAILLALAIGAKMHLLLVLPFALVYLWQNYRRLRTPFLFFLIVCCVFLILNLPYIFGNGFMQMVLFNAQQEKVGMIIINSQIDGVVFHIIPALFICLIFYSFIIKIKTRDLFLFFMGSAFCLLLIFIPPAPGWYYWILPFLIYFYARLLPTFLLPLIAIQVAYLLYFLLIPIVEFGYFLLVQTGYWDAKIFDAWLMIKDLDLDLINGLSFTALQTLLFINAGLMLYRGVIVQQQSKFRARPFMIGLAGNSGAGKTTLAENISIILGEQRVGVICGDDMHRWERGHIHWNKLTHLNPLANELHEELNFIKKLRQNKSIQRRHYDHDTGQFTKELTIMPRSVMLSEGLHTFYLQPTRNLFDLKIFIKLDSELLQHRKILRDTNKRDVSKEKVIETIQNRAADLASFIEVQERHADIVFFMHLDEKITQNDIGNSDLIIKERLQIKLSNAYYINKIISDLIEIMPLSVRHYYDSQDKQVIEMDEPPEISVINSLGEKYVEGLDLFGVYDPQWSDGWDGIMQLLIMFCILSDWEEQF